LIERVLAEHGRDGFVIGWLGAHDVSWASDLIPQLMREEAMS
jgi:type IV secretion system protein TrbE